MSNESLAHDFKQKASAHWTREREAKVVGGRKWPLMPSEAPELLRVLGLLNADASMSADAVRKFSQVNHMVTLLLPVLKDLKARHQTVRILDAGCGTSALTLILAWILTVKERHSCQLIGIDSNPAVIATSRQRAELLGLGKVLKFHAGRLELAMMKGLFSDLFAEPSEPAIESGRRPQKPPRPHLLLGLHACDTATDMALAMGIVGEVDVMAVAPCCHGELARIWKDYHEPSHPLDPIFASPNLRREVAAHMTDALRMVLVRSRGYEVTATEFVPSAHTPKNRLLLAIRRGRFERGAEEQYDRLKAATGGATLALEKALHELDLDQASDRDITP